MNTRYLSILSIQALHKIATYIGKNNVGLEKYMHAFLCVLTQLKVFNIKRLSL